MVTAVKKGQREQSPPQKDAGNMICHHYDCRNDPPIFRNEKEWKKHMDRHDRPYKCTEPSCEGRPGFTSTADLNRHRREVHNCGRKPRKSFLCPVTGCHRGNQNPFKRGENLRVHTRRCHGNHAQESIRKPNLPEDKPQSLSDKSSVPDVPSNDPRKELAFLRKRTRELDGRLQKVEQQISELKERVTGA